jgi:diacylglycerol O-acyltransferase / wax synthase
MQKLTGMDSMFVSLESDTNLFHVGAIAVMDPSTASGDSPPVHEALHQVIEDRLHLVPPFRRRLVQVPGGFDHPRWIEDPSVDLERHIRRGALPSPGSETELTEFAADVMSQRMDRSRPLWEIHVVEGLEGGLIAGVAKIHHSAVDGISGAAVTGHLMDPTPEVRRFEQPEIETLTERVPNPLSLLRDAAVNSIRRTIPTVQTLAKLPLTAVRIRNHNRVPDTLTPPGPFGSPRTQLAKPVGRQRTVGLAQIDRGEAEEVRGRTGATLNDIVLAVSGAAVHHYLREHGELPSEPLVGFVPVAVRSDEPVHATNRLSGMLVSLATDLSDPLVRLMAVSECARSAKRQEQVIGSDLFSRLSDLAVPALLEPVGRLARAVGLTTRFPPFSLVVSSFPGPTVPLYCAGAEMLAYHPLGPVIDGAALNVTAMSYKDQIGFGLIASPDAIKDVGAVASWIPESMRELSKAVSDSHDRRHRSQGSTRPGRASEKPRQPQSARRSSNGSTLGSRNISSSLDNAACRDVGKTK